MAKKKKNQLVEVVVRIERQRITVVPDQRSEAVERMLEQRGADSFVFIPLARLGKKGNKLLGKRRALARKKAKLPELEWYDGELRSLEDDGAVPGVLAFDVRRRTAREIAEKAGANQFLWGTSGAPVETHDVKLFENDEVKVPGARRESQSLRRAPGYGESSPEHGATARGRRGVANDDG